MNNLQTRVIERTSKTLTEKRAMLQLLEKEYRIDNFITLKQGFNANQIDDIETARHYVIESRVLNSGFNIKSMKPEVLRRIRMLNPNHKYKAFKKRLLTEVKRKNVELDREMSTTTFYRMLHDHENWRDYNHTSSKDDKKAGLLQTEVVVEEKQQEELNLVERNVEGVVPDVENVIQAKENGEELEKPKEKSMILERRLARPKQDALSMTMRTLGPVYFQTTVTTE